MEDKMINLTIDGIQVTVPEGTTILEAARKINVDIPTLCFLKEIHELGDCRMCIVEVEGMRKPATSCIQKVSEGMVVHTHTKAIVDARKMVLDLILSNHNRDCLTCIRNGNCELQTLAQKYNMRDVKYNGAHTSKPDDVDDKSPSIVRDNSKCVLCHRCTSMCQKVQEIGAIETVERGFASHVGTANGESLNDVDCTFCGQCIEACPVAALHEKDDTKKVWDAIHDSEKVVIAQTAPAVRVALGEEFGNPIGTNVTGKMVTALKRLGFDYAFDTNTGADITIMEEANEFIERIQNGGVLPMTTSCCPAWVRFAEKNYPDQLDHVSSCKAPHTMFGAIIKTYFAKKMNIDPSKIFVVSVMPCVAKKYEASRPEMEVDGQRDVDAVITTRELARMIKQNDIEFNELEESNFDSPMGEATGAAAIFGVTGGVMEAALRTAADVLEGRSIEAINYEQVRGLEGMKRATLTIAGKEVRILVAHGLANARKVMEEIKSGNPSFDFAEVMACPGGCINGGGQPIKSSKTRTKYDYKKLRTEQMYNIDEKSTFRKSHENPVVKAMYEEYLGKPCGEEAHKLLHTHYHAQNKYENAE
jgi:NADP-reducing hydrogenase subunit HndD